MYVIDGLISYWEFKEGQGDTIEDLHGSYDLTKDSLAAWTSQGKFGNAIEYPGTKNSGNRCYGTFDYAFTNTMSLECWLMFKGLPRVGSGMDWYSIFGRRDYGWGDFGLMLNSTSSFSLRLWVNGVSAINWSWAGVQNLVWYHLVVTLDGSQAHFYIDTDHKTPASFSSNVSNSYNELNIGYAPDQNRYPFQGIIDSVRIYNKALSQAEVEQNYNYIPPWEYQGNVPLVLTPSCVSLCKDITPPAIPTGLAIDVAPARPAGLAAVDLDPAPARPQGLTAEEV